MFSLYYLRSDVSLADSDHQTQQYVNFREGLIRKLTEKNKLQHVKGHAKHLKTPMKRVVTK